MNEKNKLSSVRGMLLVSGVVLLALFLFSGWAWSQIPAGQQIPVHWGVDGQPDRYGDKFTGLMLMPLITTGVVLLLAFLPRIEPRRNNLMRSQKAYFAVWLILLLFMLVLHVATTLNTLGYALSINAILGVSVGAMFTVMGNYMGKIRSNYMFGIRTPWTLASEQSWNKTHRLGGKLFMGSGLLTFLASFVNQGGAVAYVMLTTLLGSTAFLLLYSYVIWRDEKKPEAM